MKFLVVNQLTEECAVQNEAMFGPVVSSISTK